MGGSIGGATFQFDVYWSTQFEANPMASEKTAVDGTRVTVMTGPLNRGDVHVFKFTWATQAQLEILKGLAANPTQTFSINLGAGGTTVTGRCVAKGALKYKPVANYKGFTDGQVQGTPRDLYDGEIKVIVSPTGLNG